MAIQKPSIPRGTRDFDPNTISKRTFILDTIRGVYKKFGFMPIETPAMEQLSVLTGKYGDEGDQLIFKVLNSGDYLNQITATAVEEGYKKLTPQISEKALRYDLTVPFARYVVMHRNDIQFPFKRYQIQPVWRADRPQKGRYREFFQCDADVVGTTSLLCEVEIIMMITAVFQLLGITDYTIKINNRKILQGIVEIIDKVGEETNLCVAIDKLDKIGKDGVVQELLSKGFAAKEIETILPILELKGDNNDILQNLKIFIGENVNGSQGIAEISEILQTLSAVDFDGSHIGIDLSLARGLSYYTGAIFEIKVNNVDIGSVSGGGRYDNLTGIFGLPNVAGVGISFGVDRLYDVMENLNLFPVQHEVYSQVLFTYIDQEGYIAGLKLMLKLRNEGISCELYPENSKLKKQIEYAHKKNIPYVVIIGTEELKENKISLKNMNSGEQLLINMDDLIQNIKNIEII